MHTILSPHLHPKCVVFIDAMEQCHKQSSFSKFLGSCNEAKQALDQCLAEEKRERQKLSLQQAKERREAHKKRMEKLRE
eukprot:m.41226 g.41226  ORF g.41226 m.41226 type:complete len:79 (+) comp14902_c0_seq2:122-358(+)